MPVNDATSSPVEPPSKLRRIEPENPWDKIPAELLAHIFTFLPFSDLARMNLVNTVCRAVAHDNEYFWKRAIAEYLGERAFFYFSPLVAARKTTWEEVSKTISPELLDLLDDFVARAVEPSLFSMRVYGNYSFFAPRGERTITVDNLLNKKTYTLVLHQPLMGHLYIEDGLLFAITQGNTSASIEIWNYESNSFVSSHQLNMTVSDNSYVLKMDEEIVYFKTGLILHRFDLEKGALLSKGKVMTDSPYFYIDGETNSLVTPVGQNCLLTHWNLDTELDLNYQWKERQLPGDGPVWGMIKNTNTVVICTSSGEIIFYQDYVFSKLDRAIVDPRARQMCTCLTKMACVGGRLFYGLRDLMQKTVAIGIIEPDGDRYQMMIVKDVIDKNTKTIKTEVLEQIISLQRPNHARYPHRGEIIQLKDLLEKSRKMLFDYEP